MIKNFIIDGNNLIGKISKLHELQQHDKQSTREKLAFILERYFHNKKIKVSLHFDGFANDVIKASKLKIIYSGNRTADELIKQEIMNSKNPKVICVVSSDFNVMEFARVNSCLIKKCEDFAEELFYKEKIDEEEKRIKEINDSEIKKLFGV